MAAIFSSLRHFMLINFSVALFGSRISLKCLSFPLPSELASWYTCSSLLLSASRNASHFGLWSKHTSLFTFPWYIWGCVTLNPTQPWNFEVNFKYKNQRKRSQTGGGENFHSYAICPPYLIKGEKTRIRIITKAVNISQNWPIGECYLKSGIRHQYL